MQRSRGDQRVLGGGHEMLQKLGIIQPAGPLGAGGVCHKGAKSVNRQHTNVGDTGEELVRS